MPDLPAPDLVDLLVVTTPDVDPDELARLLAGAGFPTMAGADPQRPLRLVVGDGGSDLLTARDAARADPDRVARDPAAVRAEVTPG